MTPAPDWSTAPAWVHHLGAIVTSMEAQDHINGSPSAESFTPLRTAEQWVEHIDAEALANVIRPHVELRADADALAFAVINHLKEIR